MTGSTWTTFDMNKPTAFSDGLESLTASLGTARDKATSVAYVEKYIDDQQLTAAYKTSWLAKKIIDIPASDTFRRWRDWQAEEDQIEKLEELEKKLAIKEKMLRAYKLARLYGCCYVYFDLGDDPSQPVDPTKVKLGGIRFATVLTHRQLSPGEIEQDALSDLFGKPKWFDVVGPTTAGIVRIHPSRIIVLLGAESPDENLLIGSREGFGFRLGTSVLSAALPAVKHFDSVAANIASLVFEAKIDVIKVKGLMQIAGNPYEERKLLARYALAATAKGNNGMLILDGDTEEYEQKTYSFAGLPDIMDRYSQNACGAGDVPMSRLFGKAHSGIGATGAGENDTRNYYDHLSANQELNVTPAMATFDECLLYAALGSRPPEVHYLWASLWQNSDKERSELGRIGVATIKTLKDTGLIPDEVLSRGAVNMLTQAGVIPGLEAEYDAYFEEGGEAPWDMDEEGEDGTAEAMVPPKKPAAQKVADEQPRVPAGSPEGGQFGKGSGRALPILTKEDINGNDRDAFISVRRWSASYSTQIREGYHRFYKDGEWDAPAEVRNAGPFEEDFGYKAAKELHSNVFEKYTGNHSGDTAVRVIDFASDDAAFSRMASLKPGDTFSDTAPSSWAKDSSGLANYYGSKNNIVFEITGGTPRATFDVGQAASVVKERELLIGPGAKFTVVSNKHVKAYQIGSEEHGFNRADAQVITLRSVAEDVIGDGYMEQPRVPKGNPTGGEWGSESSTWSGGGWTPKAKSEKSLSAILAEVKAETKVKETSPKPDNKANATAENTDAINAYAQGKITKSELDAILIANLPPTKNATAVETQASINNKSAAAEDEAFAAYGQGKITKSEFDAILMANEQLTAAPTPKVKNLTPKQKALNALNSHKAKLEAQKAALGTTAAAPDPSNAQVGSSSITSASLLAGNWNWDAVEKNFGKEPPPLTAQTASQKLAADHAPLSAGEKMFTTDYTGSEYSHINYALRSGQDHYKMSEIDSAIAKSSAKKDLVVARGISRAAMIKIVANAGGEIKIGDVITDKGYASTTRRASTAASFAGGQGYGLKISIPKGARALPVKEFSNHPDEDEFLLPRGSSFRVTRIVGNIISVDLVIN